MTQPEAPQSLTQRLQHSILDLASRWGSIENGSRAVGLPPFSGIVEATGVAALPAEVQPLGAEQTRWGLNAGHAEGTPKPTSSEDTILRQDDIGLYAVFDGMGGEAGGDVASQTAAQGVADTYRNYEDEPTNQDEALDRMRHALDNARSMVKTGLDQRLSPGEFGGTTAIVAKFQPIGGELFLVWGNAGDSRLFVQQHIGAEIKSVATEQIVNEGGRNLVRNALTNGSPESNSLQDEFGIIPVNEGTRIMLCSDGITGDTERDFLPEEELRQAMNTPYSAQITADSLMELSRKYDDKSVIVVDVIDVEARAAKMAGKAAPEGADQSVETPYPNVPLEYLFAEEAEAPIQEKQPKPSWGKGGSDAEPAHDMYSQKNVYTAGSWWKDSLAPRLKQLFSQGRDILAPIAVAKFSEAREKLSEPDNRRKVAQAALGLMATGATLYGASKLGLTPGSRKRSNKKVV